MNRRTASLVSLVLALLLGCQPTSPRVGDVATVEAPERRDPVLPQATKGPDPVTPVKPAPRVFDESLLRGKEFLLESGFTGPGVRDVVVGALSGGAEAQAVEGFFKDLSDGQLDRLENLDPGWAPYLQSWAKNEAQGVSGRVRVGMPRTEGDTFVPVRVWNPSHQWAGWVVLIGSDGGWLVSDVQLSSLAPESPFDPEAAQPISSPSLR